MRCVRSVPVRSSTSRRRADPKLLCRFVVAHTACRVRFVYADQLGNFQLRIYSDFHVSFMTATLVSDDNPTHEPAQQIGEGDK